MHSQLINTKNGLKSKGLSCVKSQSKLTSNTNFKDSPIIKQWLNISKYLLMHFHGLSFHLELDCLNDKQTKVVIELKFQTKIADKRYNSHALGVILQKLHTVKPFNLAAQNFSVLPFVDILAAL